MNCDKHSTTIIQIKQTIEDEKTEYIWYLWTSKPFGFGEF
jgi:hypothetical protein